jgi:predicted transcriptional regulator
MHPLQHLLLIGFLSENIKSFLDVPGVFAAKKITRPKVTCSKEAKKAISNLHKGGRTAGQIATEIGLPTRVVRVIEARAGAPFKQKPWKFHPILRSQACAALAAGKLVSEIARSLHVSSSTIYLILNNDLDLKSQRAALIFEQRKTKARNNLLSAIKDLCPSTLSQLSAVTSGDFTWASRHDSKWLADQTKSVGLHPSCRPAVDWAMRDALFFDLISSIVEEVLRLSNPPVQLRKGEILRRIRHPLWSGFMLSRFPRTSLLLQQTVETDDSFRRRCQTSRSA